MEYDIPGLPLASFSKLQQPCPLLPRASLEVGKRLHLLGTPASIGIPRFHQLLNLPPICSEDMFVPSYLMFAGGSMLGTYSRAM